MLVPSTKLIANMIAMPLVLRNHCVCEGNFKRHWSRRTKSLSPRFTLPINQRVLYWVMKLPSNLAYYNYNKIPFLKMLIILRLKPRWQQPDITSINLPNQTVTSTRNAKFKATQSKQRYEHSIHKLADLWLLQNTTTPRKFAYVVIIARPIKQSSGNVIRFQQLISCCRICLAQQNSAKLTSKLALIFSIHHHIHHSLWSVSLQTTSVRN